VIDAKLRETLLRVDKMPTDRNGNPPTGYTVYGPSYTNGYEFALNEKGLPVRRLVVAIDGPNMNPKESWGTVYHFNVDGS
jgi:hypothetical protein